MKYVYAPTADGGSPMFNKLFVWGSYTRQTGMNWIHHNIQESGQMQDILPMLYDNQGNVVLYFFTPGFKECLQETAGSFG
ncbi:MAG: hypothetical protein ACI3XG_04730 [Faecousia sp.]